MSKNKILIHKNKYSPTKSPKEAFSSLWKPKINIQKQPSLGPESSAHHSPFGSAEQVSTGWGQAVFLSVTAADSPKAPPPLNGWDCCLSNDSATYRIGRRRVATVPREGSQLVPSGK